MAILDDTFERDSAGWEAVSYRARRAFQSPEFNEAQTILRRRMQRIADAVFSDGNVISGADVIIDANTGAVTITGGAVYVRGDVRGVPEAALTIPVVGAVEIGLRLSEVYVTELEEPGLLNPVPGAESFHAPGAARLKVNLAWGWRSGGNSDGQSGDFYPVFGVTNGVLDNKVAPPNLDGVTQALARYDRAAHGGSYIVTGLGLTPLSITDGHQVLSLGQGRCHVDGFEVEKPAATRLAYPLDPDLLLIQDEPHTYTPVSGSMRLNVNYGPIADIVQVRLTAERVDQSIVHGSYTGVADALPDLAVLQIMAVRQGATTYVQGTDYRLTGNTVDWSLTGAEPAPGSSYTVTYRYYTNGTVTAADDSGFTVSGAVSGTTITVDYHTKLPRRDRIIMNADGVVSRVKGVSDLYVQALPTVPSGALLLATLHQTWFGLPTVVADALKIMPVADLMALANRVDAILDLVAQERLKTDATAREPTGQKGIFVDPFLDNDMRDNGIAQTAAVIQGELQLPIVPIFPNPMMVADKSMLTYTLETIVQQLTATDTIKINPYDSFRPIPPKVSVRVNCDRWTQDNVVWDTESVRFIKTGHFVEGNSRLVSQTMTSESIETIASTTTAAQYLRQISITVRAEGLGNGEIVERMTFDGVAVGGPFTAGSNGVIEHTFTIPAGIPAGVKEVVVAGVAAGTGSATFTGEGQITTTERRRVATVEQYYVDPVAQSIVLTTGRHIGGVDLRFTAVGTSQVVVQMRSMTNGLPGTDVLAEARLPPGSILTNGQPTRFEWSPVWMEAGAEFCIVALCNDAVAALAIGRLGMFDAEHQRWVTEQPYQIGVMFSSSNGSSWTVHQDADLWFRLLGCRFTATSRTVSLGSLTAAQVSDLVGLFSAERPDTGTRVSLKLIAADGRIITLSDGQPVNLTSRLTGAVSVQLVLEGTDTRSPVVYPGVQAIFGVQSDSATYVSRQFACASASKIRIIADVITPGTSGVAVEVQATNLSWVTVPLSTGAPIGDGWEERTFILSSFAAPVTRVRLTLNGSALNRPRVRRLRAIAA